MWVRSNGISVIVAVQDVSGATIGSVGSGAAGSSCFVGSNWVDTGVQQASVAFGCAGGAACTFLYDVRFSCSGEKLLFYCGVLVLFASTCISQSLSRFVNMSTTCTCLSIPFVPFYLCLCAEFVKLYFASINDYFMFYLDLFEIKGKLINLK